MRAFLPYPYADATLAYPSICAIKALPPLSFCAVPAPSLTCCLCISVQDLERRLQIQVESLEDGYKQNTALQSQCLTLERERDGLVQDKGDLQLQLQTMKSSLDTTSAFSQVLLAFMFTCPQPQRGCGCGCNLAVTLHPGL